jgi:signal transduction histidine kinase
MKINITTNKKNSMIEMLISDNGPGIDESIRNKIMQPFLSTKDIGKGTGLGLSISKGLIENHQGEFHLIPNGSLTTFQILLPLS